MAESSLWSSGIREAVTGLRLDLYPDFYVTMLKAFVDDSGSGGDSPWYVLAGYVGSVRNWDCFDTEWQQILDSEPKIAYFKSSEAESLRPDSQWANVTVDTRNAKIDSLIRVIQKRARQAVHVRVKQKDYNRIIRANGLPSIWDSPYYFLFPAMVAACVSSEKYSGAGEPIEFIFDSSERHEKSSQRLHVVLANDPLFVGRIVNVLYRDEKKFLPLQAADLLAWQVRRRFCVTGEPKRRHFEDSQKCKTRPFDFILTEGDLWKALNAMRERDREWAVQHGLPPDTEVWMEAMKSGTRQMVEGTEAFERFRAAMKAALSVPKSAMPASPFKKHVGKKKRRASKS